MQLNNLSKYIPALTAVAALGLASCSDDLSNPGTSGDEIVLNARFLNAPNQEAGNSWREGSKIAVRVGGNTYNYTLSADGSLTADGESLKWNGENFALKAWTPAPGGTVSLTDQSTADKFSACDLLATEMDVTSRFVYLMFSHKMTRCSWEFSSVDNSYTQEQIDAARVSFLGYGTVNFNEGTVTPSGNPDREIATYKETASANSGEAILAPADMWGKQLVKVEIGGDEYYYVPDRGNSSDAASAAGSLEAGNWKTYRLHITRKTLTVDVENSPVEWGSTIEFGDGDITDAKLEAMIAEDVKDKPGFKITGVDNGYIQNRARGFSISYTESGLGGLSWAGSCTVTRTETAASGGNTTQTYTFTNVKSDISVTYLSGVSVGDYVYSNGAWGKEESREGCTTIGRVFHVGLDSRDDSSYSLSKVRGYVVPLAFGNTSEMQWFANQSESKYLQALSNIQVNADAATRESYYGGFKLTGMLDADLAPFSTEWAEQVPFWYAFKNIGMTAPALSSGWYIPTYAQLKDICASGMYDKFSGVYWSSQVYPGTGNAGVGGVEEGEKTTLWAIRCGADQAVGYGWAIDRAKLLPILTF